MFTKSTIYVMIFPCTSLAMAPPSVAKLVPGETGINQPCGITIFKILPIVMPDSQDNNQFYQI